MSAGEVVVCAVIALAIVVAVEVIVVAVKEWAWKKINE